MLVAALLWLAPFCVASDIEKRTDGKRDATTNAIGKSDKRGLIHITKEDMYHGMKWPRDAPTFAKPSSDITWYYNYMLNPTLTGPPYNAPFEFVPMIWGNKSVSDIGAAFAKFQQQGITVKHLLTFNEPEMNFTVGGSSILPKEAAKLWTDSIEPLRVQYNLSIGAPGISGSDQGTTWLDQFISNCTSCTFDFIPFHYYGPYQQLPNFVATMTNKYPQQKFWVTEYAPFYQNLAQETLDWFTNATTFLDQSPVIDRYSYWGAWRASETPPGWSKNMTMLNNDGKLTKIGGWYMNLDVESAASRKKVELGILWVLGWIAWSFI